MPTGNYLLGTRLILVVCRISKSEYSSPGVGTPDVVTHRRGRRRRRSVPRNYLGTSIIFQGCSDWNSSGSVYNEGGAS
jgi:hypothetical protein